MVAQLLAHDVVAGGRGSAHRYRRLLRYRIQGLDVFRGGKR